MSNLARILESEQLIDNEVKKICGSSGFDLATIKDGSPIVDLYVKKIEGKYNVGRSKQDTDNVIDLVYIAYNVTPQDKADIRVIIGHIMTDMIKVQQNSDLVMREASGTANIILRDLDTIFPDWQDCKESGSSNGDIVTFVKGDLYTTIKSISEKATRTQQDLLGIASEYDKIVVKAGEATDISQLELGLSEAKQKEINEDIIQSNAEKARLESLETDLTAKITKYGEMASRFEKRAESEEDKAFIMSIVQVGAQILSAAIPAAMMAMAGPEVLVATSEAKALKSTSAAKALKSAGKSASVTSVDEEEHDSDESESHLRPKISKKESEEEALKTKKDALEKIIKDFEDEKKAGDTANEGKKNTKIDELVRVEEIDKLIKEKTRDLEGVTAQLNTVTAVLKGLKASLDKIDEGFNKMTERAESHASSLRELQMEILNKVEGYEKERMQQAAELAKINVLLTGKHTKELTIELTIKSLNMSISALMKAKEIIVDIACFFKYFATYMDEVLAEAQNEIDNIDKIKSVTGTNKLHSLIHLTDEFFIKQRGEWIAARIVSLKFSENFSDGWTKMNSLNGHYITGKELEQYMGKAADRIKQITDDSESAAERKIIDISTYREQLTGSVKV